DDQRRWFMDLGRAYFAKANYSEAEKYYSRALSLAKDRLTIGYCLHNLAQVELKQGHLSKAAEYNQRVVADGPLDPKEPLRLYHKLTVAELAMERQSLDEAAKLLHEILATPQTDDSLRWQAESDLANVNVAQGNYVAAEREFQRGIQIVEKASGE